MKIVNQQSDQKGPKNAQRKESNLRRPLVNKTRSTFRNDFRSDVTLPFTTNHVLVASLFHCSTSSKVVWTPKQLRKVVFRGCSPRTTFRHSFVVLSRRTRNDVDKKIVLLWSGNENNRNVCKISTPSRKVTTTNWWPFGDVASKSCFEKLVMSVGSWP